MKTVLRFIAALLLGVLPLSGINAQRALPDGRKRIKDVLFEISKTYPEMIFGWEFGGRRNLIIPDFTSIRVAIEKKDLMAVAKLIAQQTDFECILDTDSFTVVPKPDVHTEGNSLARQQVVYLPANDVPVGEFLKTIRAKDDLREFALTSSYPILVPPMMSPMGVSGPVTVQGSSGECYKLLNEVCRQLKAKSWIIIRSGSIVPAQYGLPTRSILGFGEVSFQKTGEFHVWVE